MNRLRAPLHSAGTLPTPKPALFAHRRTLPIVLGVVLLHAVALWALQSGLLRRAAEATLPAVLMAEVIGPAPALAPAPAPAIAQVPRDAAPAPARPAPLPTDRSPPPVTASPAPAPLPPMAATPSAAAVAPPAEPSAGKGASTSSASPGTAAASAQTGTAAAARVDLPSSDADYLNNPKPPYPPLSRRLGEQGKVVLRVLIGADGTAQKAEIRQSSGFERLDQAALATVLKWRYVPGKRGGVPEAMWFNVPINFVLE